MEEQNIICPKCKTPLTKAIYSVIEDTVKADFEIKNKNKEIEFDKKYKELESKEKEAQKRSNDLERERLGIEKSKKEFDNILEQRVNEKAQEVRKEAEKEISDKINKEKMKEIKLLNEELNNKNLAIEDIAKKEIELRKEKNQIEEDRRLFELKKQRELDEAKQEIRNKAIVEFTEQNRMKDKEKEKIISDLKKALEDAQRKAEQRSQQLQGEVQELDLEDILRRAFPYDVIEPIAKGVKGADIRQIVKTHRGNNCGTILWESKRTKLWLNEWITIVKDNLRAEKANIPIIVTNIFPKDSSTDILLKDGVVICCYSLVLQVAEMLRQKLVEVAKEKFVSQNRGEKAELLYEYITSYEFKQQLEAIAEIYRDMNQQIIKERVSFEKIWKTREAQVQKLFQTTGGIIGLMSGKIGQSMPQIRGFELLEPGEDKKE